MNPTVAAVRRRRLIAVGASLLVLAMVGAGLVTLLAPTDAPPPVAVAPTLSPTPSHTATPTQTPTPTPAPEVHQFSTEKYSIDDPMSIWVVSNKHRPLNPKRFAATDMVTANVPYSANATLRVEAARAMERMFAVAIEEGAGAMRVNNAYRSHDLQVSVFAGHVRRLGQAQADIASARPGHSEHQTGLTADISPLNGHCAVKECFAQTSEGLWLAENGWRFGFHLRYPQGKTDVTGFAFEPWHYRYVGVELSTEIHLQGVLTLEEFFGLPPAPTYP